jgi:hypothetical protein
MKRMFYLLIMSLLFSVGHSKDKKQNITHYLFPEFTKGVVLMKTGVKKETLLNYNALTEEMIFENNGVRLAVAQMEKIDTIFINGRKFFPVNGKFFELLYHSKYDLYAEHKCNIKDPGKPSGYGGSSQTSATSTYSTYFSGGQVYDMKLPENVETNPFTIYWLKKEGVLLKFYSIRQLSKFFEEKSNQFKTYVKENNVKYDDPESLIGLIRFLSSN